MATAVRQQEVMAGPDGARHPQPAGVSDPPKPAPNLHFAGQMKDGAFEGHQYLVERDGQFLQLSELLLLTLAHVDGKRSVEEIAKGVSAKAFRNVTPDNVRALLAKLVPLGLVAGADGSLAPSARERAAQSPMQVQFKMAVIPPAVTNAITSAFGVLYFPAIVIGVLLASFAAHAWFYLIHGVGKSVHDVLYSPGLILILLGFFVVSAAFHELGHGAGLRYSGGTVRAMGAGLYLVYPVFYTDITDAYRLSRGKKLRTSLGGFYFNLIFSLGVLGVYLLTGAEFLLIVMALIDLEILFQMLPFVRMDGYWILADLSGIPDFFSQMGAFVRAKLGKQHDDVPELKPWAKRIFIIYTIVVAPLIAFLVFIAIKTFPAVFATALDSGSKLAASAGEGLAKGDGVAVAAAIAQIAILGLQVVGLGMVVFRVLKKVFVSLWNWGSGSPVKRTASSFASLAIVALLVFLWAPALPTGAPGPLYATAQQNSSPIPQAARGTIGDAVPVVDTIVPPALREPAPSASPAAPEASPSSAPASSPSAVPSSTSTVAPLSTPPPATVAPTLAPTPASTPLPSSTP
jgi:putative peptide zinc metalloprotease protein